MSSLSTEHSCTAIAGTGIAPALRMLGLALATVAVAWAALYALRPAHVVTGTIDRVVARTYPWSINQGLTLIIKTPAGVYYRAPLQGRCEGSPQPGAACVKPAFPRGAQVSLVVHGFTDPNTCGFPTTTSRYQRRMAALCARGPDRIGAISVAGRPVADGWWNRSNTVILYTLVAAIVGVLWSVRDNLSRLSLTTFLLFWFALQACLLGVF